MAQVDIQLRFLTSEITPRELVAFRRQLDAEPELHGRVKRLASDVPSGPDDGRMGASVPELLVVSLSSGGAVSALIAALPSLLRARRSAATVEVTTPDGRTAKITAESADDARVLLETALRDHDSGS